MYLLPFEQALAGKKYWSQDIQGLQGVDLSLAATDWGLRCGLFSSP